MKPSSANVNCRSGLAAIRSSVRLVSESSVWNSRPTATVVAGTSMMTAATYRWKVRTSLTLWARPLSVLILVFVT